MASRSPAKQFPLQCPSPWCGKGFNDVPQIQKHISMTAHCGMYLQKLLHAQSQTFGIPSPTTGSPQSISNINNPFAAADVCFPINHHEPDNLPADEDGLIMDESTTVHSEADSETNTHNLPIQTIECHTNEQYLKSMGFSQRSPSTLLEIPCRSIFALFAQQKRAGELTASGTV